MNQISKTRDRKWTPFEETLGFVETPGPDVGAIFCARCVCDRADDARAQIAASHSDHALTVMLWDAPVDEIAEAVFPGGAALSVGALFDRLKAAGDSRPFQILWTDHRYEPDLSPEAL